MANKQINELSELTTASGTDWMVVYDNSEAGSEKTKKITVSNIAGWPNNWIDGFILSNGADTDHDITISAGQALDSTNGYALELTSPITKQIDASWAAGSDAGGLFSGSVATSTWYHMFIIRKDSDGSIDAGFDTDPDAANIPGDYTAYRRIGSVYADGSANIDPFIQHGDRFRWYDRVGSGWANPGTSRTITCRVPTGIEVWADIQLKASDYSPSGGTYIQIRAHDQINESPGISNCDLWLSGGNEQSDSSRFKVRTNTSGQVFTRQSQSTGDHRLYYTVNGWYDDRGKNGQ